MHPLTSAMLLASASLAVAFAINTSKASVHAGSAQHARNAQARNPKQYILVDHYSAEDFMDER